MKFIVRKSDKVLINSQSNLMVSLGRYEYKLLEILIERNGILTTSEELIDNVWEKKYVASGSLTKAICTLRSVLKDTPPYKIIINIPRKGYYISSSSIKEFIFMQE